MDINASPEAAPTVEEVTANYEVVAGDDGSQTYHIQKSEHSAAGVDLTQEHVVDMPKLDSFEAPELASFKAEEIQNTSEIVATAEFIEDVGTAQESMSFDQVEETTLEVAEESTSSLENTIENSGSAPEPEKSELDDDPEAKEEPEEIFDSSFDESVTEFVQENTSQDQNPLETVMEAEAAVAHMIMSSDVVQPEESEETHILGGDDVGFPLVHQEVTLAEMNSSGEVPNVEYDVLNEQQEGTISVNGLHELTKEDVSLQDGLYQIGTVVKADEELPFVEDGGAEEDSLITTVDEVTYTDVEMLKGEEAMDELTDESEQQVVILQGDDPIALMEDEDEKYDQPETIEVNIVEDQTSYEDPSEEQMEDEEEDDEDESKPKSVRIPCHVLGRSIKNPLDDPVRNGRVLLKPRLGVKIPYRNLTSQIVSKNEIAEEIMERSRIRQSSAEPPAGGDVFFAKKLTQRLAKKLVSPGKSPRSSTRITSTSPSGSSAKRSGLQAVNSKSPPAANVGSRVVITKVSPESPKVQAASVVTENVEVMNVAPAKTTISATKAGVGNSGSKMTDNSDLIALLEGDDDLDWRMDLKSEGTAKRTAEWERETALKQLKELPKQLKGVVKSPKDTPAVVPKPPEPPVIDKDPLEPNLETAVAENSKKEAAVEDKDELSIQPRFSSSTPIKTYTRKRKPYEDNKSPPVVAPSKKAAAANEPKEPKQTQKPPPALNPIKQASPNTKQPPVLSPQKSPPPVQKPAKTTAQKSSSIPTLQKISPNVQVKVPAGITVQKVSGGGISNSPKLDKVTPTKPDAKKVVGEKRQMVAPITPKAPTMPLKKTLSPNTYISKSSRIVKRKKIWDPDEATPRGKSVGLKLIKGQDVALKVTRVASPPVKPVEKKARVDVAPTPPPTQKDKVPFIRMANERGDTPRPKPAKPAVLKPSNEKSPPKKLGVQKVILKKKLKQRLTEVDKLLMDEGAVNLLYSVNKNNDELQNLSRKKKKKALISLDKVQRDLMNKTNEIKNDLQINNTNNSPMSLRRSNPKPSPPGKEVAGVAVLQRKKSKDSTSGSVHSPPASPGYAYGQHADASRIIRRHSSSSFSSEASDADEDAEEKSGEKTSEKTTKHKATEPQKKKTKANHEKPPKGLVGIDKQLLNEEMSKNFNKVPPDDPKYSRFNTFNVRKFDNLIQIILASTSANGQTTLSVEVLKELAEVLDVVQNDSNCRVIVISSSGSSFCQGIDYKELASDDDKERLSVAEKYAAYVREFLTALTKFTKILVAGVHGNTVGLGVTMLPLFDMVLASDTATFSTPYAQLGCAAEGGVLLTLPHVMHNALASELFFASRKLTAAEALRLGLVTRTLWPDKFQEELISALKVIAGQSLQSMQAIKKQLRHHLLSNVEASLKSESSALIEHWTSSECQSNFKEYSVESK